MILEKYTTTAAAIQNEAKSPFRDATVDKAWA